MNSIMTNLHQSLVFNTKFLANFCDKIRRAHTVLARSKMQEKQNILRRKFSVSLEKDSMFCFHIYFSASFPFYFRVSYTYIHTYIYIYIYIHKKATSSNTKAFVHILVNFFTCALTWFARKFKSEILAETPQTKRKE